jgi:hypothetical protein
VFTPAMYYLPPVFGPHQVWPGHSPGPGVYLTPSAGARPPFHGFDPAASPCAPPARPSLGGPAARSRATPLRRLSRLSRLRRPSTCQAGSSTPPRGASTWF